MKKLLAEPPMADANMFMSIWDNSTEENRTERVAHFNDMIAKSYEPDEIKFERVFDSSSKPILLKVNDYEVIVKKEKKLDVLKEAVAVRLADDMHAFLDEIEAMPKSCSMKTYRIDVSSADFSFGTTTYTHAFIEKCGTHAQDFGSITSHEDLSGNILESQIATSLITFILGVGDNKDANYLYEENRGIMRVDYGCIFGEKTMIDADTLALRRPVFEYLQNRGKLSQFVEALSLGLTKIKWNFPKLKKRFRKIFQEFPESPEMLLIVESGHTWLSTLKKILKRPKTNILTGIFPETSTAKDEWEDQKHPVWKSVCLNLRCNRNLWEKSIMNVAWLSLWDKHKLKMPDKPDMLAPTLLEYIGSKASRANAIFDGALDKSLDALGADIMYRGAQRLVAKAIVAGAVVVLVSKSMQKKQKKEKPNEDGQI